MPRAQKLTRAATLEFLQGELDKPEALLVTCRLLVHRHRGDDLPERCWCCGSREAVIDHEVHIGRLLIDTVTRDRFHEQDYDAATWADMTAGAHPVEMRLSCSAWHDVETGYSAEQVLLDRETPEWLVSGAQRSGKTQDGCTWLALRWFWFGGDGVRFRVQGPEMPQAHVIKEKLCVGDDDADPILPAETVNYYPEDQRKAHQWIDMVDGSSIQLTHTKSEKHLKGFKCKAILWTEATECQHVEIHTVTLGRTVQGGQVYVDGTPKAGHWMRPVVMSATKAREKELQDGVTPPLRAISKPMAANPWLNPEEVAMHRAASWEIDPTSTRRDYDGEWVGNHAMIFGDVWDAEVHVVDVFSDDLSSLGLVDATRKVSRRWFKGVGHDWIAGADVNYDPHTAVVCKLFEVPGSDGVTGIIVMDTVRTPRTDAYEAAFKLRTVAGGKYQGIGVALDANGSWDKQHVSHTGGRATTPVKDYERLGFDVRCNKHTRTGRPANPPIRDSTALIRHLMRTRAGPTSKQTPLFLVSARCKDVINAIESQQDDGTGKPIKVSGAASDRMVAAYTDSLRYIVWPFFQRGVYSRPVKFINHG